MKKIAIRVLTLTLFVFFVYSCNEEITIDEPIDDLELKSGNIEKISYIVLVNDAELNTELSNLKGYEKKQQAVKLASAKILKRAGVIGGEVEHVYGTAVKGFSIKIPPGQLNKLVNDPAVLSVEEDQIITLIEPKAKPGDGDVEASAAQVTPWGITRVYGGATYTGSKVAWIIDTGIDLDHPDLNVNEEKSATFVDRTTTANDDNGHGSHVAGTVAAKNNDIGVIGVAAGATVVP
ncbi:MAG: S8 family serine peptidase, partial [Bacteroidota bacterium]